MRRATTLLLTAAALAVVGCGDETSTGTGGGTGCSGTGGSGTGTVGSGGGGAGGDGGGTSTSTTSATSTGSGDGGAGGEAGGAQSGGPSLCGNGVVEVDETCDDGGESATCDVDCTPAACGDAVLNVTAGEACDEAGETAECDEDCTLVSCGDGTVNAAAGETCEDGNDVPGDGCWSCGPDLHPQCGEPYAVLNTADRNVTHDNSSGTTYCDAGGVSPGWVGVGWYRFEGAAGTMMPVAPPPPFSCATDAAGWLNGEHPAIADGVVGRQVCWSYTPGPCWQVGNIEVVNCGDFYLYNLTTPLSCSYRYCGTTCGDGVVDPGETCDDGNLVDGDGCPRGCGQPVCGNGVVDDGEQCDDGNDTGGDGCSPSCVSELDPQCGQPYITLSLANRNVSFNDNGATLLCDELENQSGAWDGQYQGPGWYRFSGAAGTRMPEQPPGEYACGTHAAGWLADPHPTEADGVVARDVCFHWAGDTCWQTAPVEVVDCGSHYLYNLRQEIGCSLRFCGTN